MPGPNLNLNRWAQTPNYSLPKRMEVELWSSAQSSDGGFTDSCERHGGENNSSAQARMCPRTGKYSYLPGLEWMRDIKSYGVMWSGVDKATQATGDADVGGGTAGKVVPHDYLKGGPYTRLEHLHVVDCAGYDYMQLYYQGKCLGYEGLAIDTAAIIAAAAAVNYTFADVWRIGAAGMPCIDSSDSLFTLPKLARLNDQDSLALEGSVGAAVVYPTFSGIATPDTIPLGVGVNNKEVSFRTTGTLPTGLAINTPYFIRDATSTTLKVALSVGGSAVAITPGTGSGVHTMVGWDKAPGTGNARGIPFQLGATHTDPDWEPESYIFGGAPLFAQYRGAYGTQSASGTSWHYWDHVAPCVGFETNSWNAPYPQGRNGPPGIFQEGKIYLGAGNTNLRANFTRLGSKFEAAMWLGYPNHGLVATATPSISNNNWANQTAAPLRITGLARIALNFGAIGVPWGTGTGGYMMNADGSPNTTGTRLVSTPNAGVGAVAPREWIRGRVVAVLTRD